MKTEDLFRKQMQIALKSFRDWSNQVVIALGDEPTSNTTTTASRPRSRICGSSSPTPSRCPGGLKLGVVARERPSAWVCG